ncbi:MAG: sigma 54-interacting transcriptional regulator [Blastocatellia bacterium]
MKSATILLLDFNSSNSLCDILKSIFESSSRFKINLKQKSVRIFDPAYSHGDLIKTILRLSLDMIFLIPPIGLLKQAGMLLQSIRKGLSEIPIIVNIDSSEPDNALELLKLGASDFITPPLKAIDILPRVWRLLEKARQMDTPMDVLKEKLGLKQLVGKSPAFVAKIKELPLLAKCDVSVLIAGETGTGKELCARAIHYLSQRATKPFVPVNCGAIPTELVENELFGHEREAFTGALTSRLGLIQEADGGTLFLDEIDCLSLLAQVKLLRFLQEKEYRPLGAMKMRQANVRVMAATNSDLEEAVRKGKLRQDLYYRLNIIPMVLPPLRDRKQDIPLLARHFLAKYTEKFDKRVTDFSPDAMQTLMFYNWPGNVRELEHIIERAIVLTGHEVISNDNICLPHSHTATTEGSFQRVKARVVAEFEKAYVERLLLAHQGNITRAAQAAQKDRRALRHLIRKHRIDVQSFKSSA